MDNPVNIAMIQSFTLFQKLMMIKKEKSCKYLLREGYTLVLKPEA